MPRNLESTSPADTPELLAAEHVARLMQFWGFKRPMGRVWTILYLSDQPLTAAEIGQRLCMSPAAVSLALSQLLEWGAAKKSWRPGERRELYEAEPDVWALVRRVLRDRELLLLRELGESFEQAQAQLSSDRSFASDRLQHLRALTSVGENLLARLVSGDSIDPSALERAQPTSK